MEIRHESLPAHLHRTADAARRRYAAADISYGAAADDTGTAPGAYYRILDKSCAAQLQGPYRLQRARPMPTMTGVIWRRISRIG